MIPVGLLSLSAALLTPLEQRPQVVLHARAGYLYRLAFTADGQRMLTRTAPEWKPGVIQVWETRSGKLLTTIKPPTDLTFIQLSPDGRIRLWHVARLREGRSGRMRSNQ